MNTEEDAFICALRERPDDETARLVYTDWLDDRSDPRAEYFRAEAAWVALQPSDEQYRPLYRRVSQLAAGLELGWFTTVGRMGHRARSEWERVAPLWEPQTPARTPVSEWAIARLDIASVFTTFVGAGETERRFCVPVDYAAFMATVGGGWDWNSGWSELYTATDVARHTRALGSAYDGNRSERLEMWAVVALLGDRRSFFLCCDLLSPRFGKLAEGEDHHPWIKGSQSLRHRADTFLQFLGAFLGE